MRTTIALISLGFVLARIGPWLNDSATKRIPNRASLIGIALVSVGASITLLAAWRYDAVNRQIEGGLVKTDRGLVWFVAIAITVVSAALIVYMTVMSGSE